MGAMTAAAKALHAKVEAAVIEEVQRIGPEIDKAALVKRFAGRGAGRSALYLWVDRILASGKPGQAVARQVKAAAAARAARSLDPAADAAAEVARVLPARVAVDDVAGTGTGGVRLLDRLARVVADAELVVAYAKTTDGGVRNAKLLLSAGDALRRAAETILRVTEAMHQVDQVEKFHDEIIDALRAESPGLAERVVRRLNQLAMRWGGG